MKPLISVGFSPSSDKLSIIGFRSIIEKTLLAAALEVPKASTKGVDDPKLMAPIIILKNTFVKRIQHSIKVRQFLSYLLYYFNTQSIIKSLVNKILLANITRTKRSSVTLY